MKNQKMIRLTGLVALGLALNVNGQPADEPSEMLPPPAAQTPVLNAEDIAPIVEEAIQNVVVNVDALLSDPAGQETGAQPEPGFSRQGTTPSRFVAPSRNGLTNTAAPAAVFNLDNATAGSTPPDRVVKDGEKGLRFNFDKAPLETVLSYLSDAAGFTIISKVSVRGTVTVMSSQPLDKDEAVALLGRVLAEEGYGIIRDDRTLTIMTQEMVRRSIIPVRVVTKSEQIPKDKQIVTTIVPVRFINAAQLANDLAPLMASSTTMTANQGGNALVITDTQENTRRLVEIVNAIDTTVSSLSAIKVFTIKYADAKTIATMIKDVFSGTDSGGGAGGGGRGGRGGAMGAMVQFMGGGGGQAAGGGSSGRPGASRVIATADDRSNALVVSAPDDLMTTIEQLVASVDVDVTDVTEIRIFRLQHSDPQETVDLITGLFPDPTSTSQGGRGQRGAGAMFGGAPAASTSTERSKLQSKVVAVPDYRTGSVVVTAAHETMLQIAQMIKELDADDAKQQKVYVFDLENVDPTTAQQILQDTFSGTSSSATRARTTTGQAGSQLGTRAQQQNTGRNTTGTRSTGTSGFGGSTGSTGMR